MNGKSILALTLTVVLAAFSFGILLEKPARSQGKGPNTTLTTYVFPRQADLWSLSAPNLTPANSVDWHGNNGGIFVVAPDQLGRLPVVTNIHSGKGTDAGYNFNLDMADAFNHAISQFLTSSDTFHDNNLGVVLQPGTYFIQWSDNRGLGDMKRLLLSGYWASP